MAANLILKYLDLDNAWVWIAGFSRLTCTGKVITYHADDRSEISIKVDDVNIHEQEWNVVEVPSTLPGMDGPLAKVSGVEIRLHKDPGSSAHCSILLVTSAYLLNEWGDTLSVLLQN